MWERKLRENVGSLSVPEEARKLLSRPSLKRLIDWLLVPDARFGPDPASGRDRVLVRSLEQALADLKARFGQDMEGWKYGHQKMHHTLIRHPLSGVLKSEIARRLDIGPVARAGNSSTVNQTNNSDNQRSGASFRVIVDLEDWDLAVATSVPGQSGDPDSPHYRDLTGMWATGKYFPLYFSRSKIESTARSRTLLEPAVSARRPDRR